MAAHTITQAFVESKNRDSSLIAFQYFDGTKWANISWQDYYRMSERLAGCLASLGLKPGDRVVVMSGTRYQWAVADQAILGMGCITVPVYQSSTPEDLEFIVNNCEASAIIVEDEVQLKKLKGIKVPASLKHTISFLDTKDSAVISWRDSQQKGEKYLNEHPGFFENSAKKVKLEDVATIVYTSGTTGLPKGVVLTHDNIESECVEILPILDLSEKDVTLTFLPMAHIFGRVETWAHIFIGWRMCFAESIDKIAANLGDVKPTFLLAVPRIFEKIYDKIIGGVDAGSPIKRKLFYWAISVGEKVSQARQKKQDIPLSVGIQYAIANKLVFSKINARLGGRIRYLVSGGAPLPREIAEFFHAAGILILEGYGLTETTAAVFVNTPYEYKFGSVGKKIGEVQMKIAGDGEILVKSKKILREYYKNPEATNESIKDGWFYTGDIGHLDSDGFLTITDRKKDLFKTSGGKYVAPQKLENALKTSKYISQAVVYGDSEKYIVALVTLNPEEAQRFAKMQKIKPDDIPSLAKHPKVISLIQEIVNEKNSHLASFETIKRFVILPGELTVDKGELTPSLKVKRKAVYQRYDKELKSMY